jgi:hypothetical protein
MFAPCLTLIVLLSTLATVALASPPHVAKLVGEFFETEQVDVAVSGSVVVGVSTTNVLGGNAVRNLQLVHVPAPVGGQVCLTMLSRDGIYHSRNTFSLPKESIGNVVRIPYDKTKRQSRLDAYGPQDLAARVTNGNCTQNTNEYFVLDSAGPKAADTIRIFVNSFGATDVFYRTGKDGQDKPCTQIVEGRRTSYDYWCDIPWPRGTAERHVVEIVRERFGREMPAVSLTLHAKAR